MYLLLGGAVYVAGFQLYLKKIRPNKAKDERLKFTDKRLLPYLVGCFVLMLPVSALISLFVLKHDGLDLAYVLINSLVATAVFGFAINPDETQLKLPDWFIIKTYKYICLNCVGIFPKNRYTTAL